MTERTGAPAEIASLAEERAAARRERDYATADRLKSEIEEAGWRVIDAGDGYRLVPAHPPNVVEDGVVRYGSSAGVVSLLDEPPSAPVTIVLPDGASVTDPPARAHFVRVGAQPLEGGAKDGSEVVRTAGSLGLAADWNIGIRRSVGEVVVLLAPGVSVGEEAVGRLSGALAEASVAVAGADGLSSADLRRWLPAPAGEVDALGPSVLAFRRADARDRGPLDERFIDPLRLAVWWSLVLRDEGTDRPPRRALALELAISRPEEAGPPSGVEQRDRAARRDFYRLIDRFGRRFNLLREPVRPTAASARARRQRRPPE